MLGISNKLLRLLSELIRTQTLFEFFLVGNQALESKCERVDETPHQRFLNWPAVLQLSKFGDSLKVFDVVLELKLVLLVRGQLSILAYLRWLLPKADRRKLFLDLLNLLLPDKVTQILD